MSTKTRPARKVRAEDTITFGGQPFDVCAARTIAGDEVRLVGHAAGCSEHSFIAIAGNTPLEVTRRKAKRGGLATGGLVADESAKFNPEKDAGVERVYALGPFAGPLPTVREMNESLGKMLGVLPVTEP